jgi:hypothetical protein
LKSKIRSFIPAPGTLADLIAANPSLKAEDQQAVLDALDVSERLRLVLGYLEREREIRSIGQRTREELSKNQHEYVLRQQLEEIRRELGETDERGAEIAELRKRLEEARLPDEPRKEGDFPGSMCPYTSFSRKDSSIVARSPSAWLGFGCRSGSSCARRCSIAVSAAASSSSIARSAGACSWSQANSSSASSAVTSIWCISLAMRIPRRSRFAMNAPLCC